ncbi:MAG: prolipoprotein diacylglyceryl transferase [Acidobacteriaceae bacterium]
MYPRLFQIGHIIIPTYGAFIAVALVAALASLPPLARRLGLDAGKLWNLGLIGILTALISARLLVVAEFFSVFRQHPFWVIGLAANRAAPWIEPAAILLGIAATLLYILAEGLPFLRVLDCAAPAATLGLAISSIGAFLSGAGYGLPSSHTWAVTYTRPFAYFWYLTPLGTRLYPVQLYQAIAFLIILAALLWRLPHRHHDGELAGIWLFLAGLASSFIDLYRAFSPTHLVAHQAVCISMVLASAAFLLRRNSRFSIPSAYNVVDDPQHV